MSAFGSFPDFTKVDLDLTTTGAGPARDPWLTPEGLTHLRLCASSTSVALGEALQDFSLDEKRLLVRLARRLASNVPERKPCDGCRVGGCWTGASDGRRRSRPSSAGPGLPPPSRRGNGQGP